MVDPETSASIAAVAIAGVAFCVALSQVVQQYGSSGQLIRLCDSVVYGGPSGLPGRGRRVYQFTQFRFRIIYDVPVFGLPTVQSGLVWDAPPVSANASGIDVNENEERLEQLSSSPQVGEASWVSFCRKAKSPCYDHLVIRLVKADADRCPPDLPNIAVPVSLRDVAIMAFAMGLECTESSFVRKTLSMEGPAGSLGSSNHPVLGPLIHFIPRQSEITSFQPSSWKPWVARLYGMVPVGSDIVPHGGKRGRAYYETVDRLLQVLRRMLLCKDEFPDGLARTVMNPHGAMQAPEKPPFLESETPLSGLTYLSPADDSGLGNGGTGWYWMSQMNVFQGPWATPWKRSVDAAFCIVAYSLIQGLLISDRLVADQVVEAQYDEMRGHFEHGVPFRSEPPFMNFSTTDSHHPGFGDLTWRYYKLFGSKLPPLVILVWNGLTDREDRRRTLSDYSAIPADLIVIGIMKLDHWLRCAAGTSAVFAGQTKIMRKIPAIVDYLLSYSYERFKATRELAITQVQQLLQHMGLSPAERVYSMVATLRTLLVAACIGVGQDTLPALEILDNDLPVHFV